MSVNKCDECFYFTRKTAFVVDKSAPESSQKYEERDVPWCLYSWCQLSEGSIACTEAMDKHFLHNAGVYADT